MEILKEVYVNFIDSHIFMCKRIMYQNLSKFHPLFLSSS